MLSRPGRYGRRGSVLILVIGVLAMLFVIGSTQLMVARSQRRLAEEKGLGTAAKEASLSAVVAAAATVSEDIVGLNATPYDRGWSLAESSIVEDNADFLGRATTGTLAQQIVRSGDLSLASLEPFWTGTGWTYYALTWGKDTMVDWNDDGILTPNLGEAPSAINVWPDLWTSIPAIDGFGDADGDGVLDSRYIGAMAGCDIYQRIIPHGGMVMLDRMTHPALLAQVIHPKDRDGVYQAQPWKLFLDGAATTTADEARLRRRFILPGNTPDWDSLPPYDLRRFLPITLGYESPVSQYQPITPHWQRVGTMADRDAADLSKDWWKQRVSPGPALTAATYNSNNDMYDRRHLLTTRSGDDLLRPNRDERVLYGDPSSLDPAVLTMRQLYYILNPETQARMDGTVYAQPLQAYGMIDPGSGPTLAFNKPGLRTQFSLRDVLDRTTETDTTGTGTFARVMQLTAYYLAMIQHTAASTGRSETDQLRLAAQLAVNTIDYADADAIPTVFALYDPAGTTLVVEVVGLEKQPYITEAYAKVVSTYTMGKVETLHSNCVFGVELYNPYDVDLDLKYYSINDIGLDVKATARYLADGTEWSGKIPAKSYLLFVNQAADPVGNISSDNYPFTATDNATQRRMVVIPELNLSPHVAYSPQSGEGEGGGEADRRGLDHVKLRRATTDMLVLTNGTSHSALTSVVVDQLGPDSVNSVSLGAAPQADPTETHSTTVRHTSLQRHKERDPAFPITWHFTLALQVGRESIPKKSPDSPDPDAKHVAPTKFDPKHYHKLLFTTNVADGSNFPDDELLCKEGDASCDPVVAARFHDVPPMPIIVGDNGLDPTTAWSDTGSGCAAFPTTGSLLLVTMNGHTSYYGVQTSGEQPLSVLSTTDSKKLFEIDHNHMPLWADSFCLDNQPDAAYGGAPQGRLDLPWGQLVFSYFTALPLEELTQTDPPFLNAVDQTEYENTYLEAFGVLEESRQISFYPLVERVQDAPAPYGARVRGRVNINFAPWWVLDGLPALPPYLPSAGDRPVNGIPVSELLPAYADPSWPGIPAWPASNDPRFLEKAGQRPGQLLSYMLFDESSSKNAGFTTISPDFAMFIEAFREKRLIPGMREVTGSEPNYLQDPGYLTPGAVCNVLPFIEIPAYAPTSGAAMGSKTFGELRTAWDVNDTGPIERARRRPFSYLGYLQLVAPVVRLQDWATVKSHVYTVYNLIGDGNGTWLRSQTTIDRTRCLYTNDLPEKITQSEPIDYFNTAGDQE